MAPLKKLRCLFDHQWISSGRRQALKSHRILTETIACASCTSVLTKHMQERLRRALLVPAFRTSIRQNKESFSTPYYGRHHAEHAFVNDGGVLRPFYDIVPAPCLCHRAPSKKLQWVWRRRRRKRHVSERQDSQAGWQIRRRRCPLTRPHRPYWYRDLNRRWG